MSARLLVLLLVLFPSFLLADVKGSNIAVSVEPFFTFPQNPLLGIANEMRGFGWFNSGFALQNASTDCLFTGVFPISGVIDMNGGTYTLNQDFITKNTIDLQSLGIVMGNGHSMAFCASVDALPAATFNATHVVINDDVTLTGTLVFQGVCSLSGNGNTLSLGSGAGIYIDSGATLTIRDIALTNISNGNILCGNDSSSLILDTVKWSQNGAYTFSTGSMQFIDYVGFFGGEIFTYASAYTSTIQSGAVWEITDEMQIVIGKKTSTAAQPLYMEDSSAQLRLSNCHLTANQYGINFTRGTLSFDNIVLFDDLSTSTANGIIIGNGTANQDAWLKLEAGSSVLLGASHLVFNSGNPNIIITGANKGARLKRYSGSNIYLQKNLIFPSMSFEADSMSIPPIILANGVVLDFVDTLMVRPDSSFDVTSARTVAKTYQLEDGDSISLTKGTFSPNIYVIGTHNNLDGNGTIDGNITLRDQNASLNFALQGFVNGNMSLNGGTIAFSSNMVLSTDASITGSGTLNMADKSLSTPFEEFSLTCSLQLLGTNAVVNLSGETSLLGTMTIVGNIIINGRGNVFEIKNGGAIYVSNNSSLTIKDTHLVNFNDSHIMPLGDNARIIIDNSSITLGGNIYFSTGSLLFKNAVDIIGTYTLFYESTQTSTINDDAVVHIANGVKLILSRHPVSQAEPIYFGSATSILHMDNISLLIGSTGAKFTNGTLLCDNNVDLDIVSTTTPTGLELGDGTPQDTTRIVLNAGATLNNIGGVLVYNIGNPNGLVSNTRGSQIVRSPLSETYLKTGINLSNVTMTLLATPQLTIPTPQTFNYSNVGISLPNVQYTITGRRYTNSSNLLYGNGLIFMTRGTYPLGTVVSGTGNVIQGNGAIGGPVSFLSSSAQLQWFLNGPLIGNMSLNGGTLILGTSLYLGRGTQVNNGIVNLGQYSFVYGSSDVTVSQNNYFSGNVGALELSANLFLDAVWTFSQNCVLNGHGNTLYMRPGGAIIVEKGSTLCLKDLNIRGVANNNIRCLDNNCQLILDDVYWQQSNSFTYTLGTISYHNMVEMTTTGSYVFAYQSSRTSTVNANSTLQLDSGFTFSYDPIFVPSKDLLAFVDETAVLKMSSATLHATVTGMDLTRGSLIVSGESYFESEQEVIDPFTHIDEGISFGDDNADNDMYVEVRNAALITVPQGSIHYRNVQPSSLFMFNEMSAFYIKQGASLYLSQNLPLGVGALRLQVGSQLIKDNEDVSIIGSVFLVE